MKTGRALTLGRYYDWLSWFQRVTSWIGQGGGYRSFTVHRLLASSDPSVDSADVVHERILRVVDRFDFAQGRSLHAPIVLDAGCGLGGTIFYLHRRLGGEYHGLTLSPTQRAHAEREAVRRGVAAACRFHVRSYDDNPGSVVPGGADLVVAIESLAHSPDPVRSIGNLAAAVRPGGSLVIVDDMPDDGLASSDHDFAAFRDGWRCAAIAPRGVLLGALPEAGLIVDADHDLTPLVSLRDPRALDRLTRSNRRWRMLARWTGAGELIDSLYGGLMLERLYRRGLMQYRLVAARRTAASG